MTPLCLPFRERSLIMRVYAACPSIPTNAILILVRERGRQLSIPTCTIILFSCCLFLVSASLSLSSFSLPPSLWIWTGIFRAGKLIARHSVSLRYDRVTEASQQRIIKRARARIYTGVKRFVSDGPTAMGTRLTPNCGLRRLCYRVPLIRGRYGTRA